MARVQDVLDADGSVVRRRPVIGDMRWDGRVWQRWSGKRWTRAAYSLHPKRLADAAPLHHEPPVTDERRHRALHLAVEDEVTTHAATVILDGPGGVVVAYRRHVSHGFHAVATILTGGLWSVVWLADALGRREERVQLEVDDWGNVWARMVAST